MVFVFEIPSSELNCCVLPLTLSPMHVYTLSGNFQDGDVYATKLRRVQYKVGLGLVLEFINGVRLVLR